MVVQQRGMRADSERTVRTILEAAERVLADDPTASMERIAEAAGVARTTVHRRFATREALLQALSGWAIQQFNDAVNDAHPESTPPLIALYQVTANVLRVKINWRFAMDRIDDPNLDCTHTEILNRCDDLFHRAQHDGLLAPDTDLTWARRVYYALIREVCEDPHPPTDPDAVAAMIVRTLLHGFGTPSARL